MDDASYKQLLWSAEEYEASGFGRALRSVKGLEVLRACGQDDPTSSPLFGSLVRAKAPDGGQYSAKYVHSVAEDAETGKLQVVKVLSVSKNAGSRVSRRVPDNQLRGVQRSASGDVSAIAEAHTTAAQLGLTDRDIAAAHIRMQLIRVLCDYCDAQQKLQELNPQDTEYLDAEDDVSSFSELIDDLIQQYKHNTTAPPQQQQQQHNHHQLMSQAAAPAAPVAAAAAIPQQIVTPQQAAAAALPAYPPTLMPPHGLPFLPQQQQQQLYQLHHVLPMSAAAAASVPVSAGAAMLSPLPLHLPFLPGLPPTAAAVLPSGITMQQSVAAAAAPPVVDNKPYANRQQEQQQTNGHCAEPKYPLPPTTAAAATAAATAAAAAAGLNLDTTGPPADSAAAAKSTAAAAPSWLKPWRVSSRRPKYLVGSEPQLKPGQKLPEGGLEPAPECNLCYKEVDTLVWSGRVSWHTADGAHSGTFRSCGHLYTPTTAAGDRQKSSSNSSSDRSYWLRYQQLPKTLEFTIDTRASTFEAEVWSKPPPGGVTAPGLASPVSNNNSVSDRVIPLSAGWDLAPLVLVPKGSKDVVGLGTFMQLLRNTGGQLNGLHMARGCVQMTLSSSSSSSRRHTPLTGHTFISYNPNGPLMDLLQQQLLPAARKQWAPATAPKTYDAKGLLYDSINPVAVVTTIWWAWDSREDAFVPNAPPGITAAVAAAAAATQQMERQLQQQQRELAAAGWQRQNGQQQQRIQGSAGGSPAKKQAAQQQQSSSEQHSNVQHSGKQQKQHREVTSWATPRGAPPTAATAGAKPSIYTGPLSPRGSFTPRATAAAAAAQGGSSHRRAVSPPAAHTPRSLPAAAADSRTPSSGRSRSRDRVPGMDQGRAAAAAAANKGSSSDHEHSPDHKRPRHQYDMESSSRVRDRILNRLGSSRKRSRSPSPGITRSGRKGFNRDRDVLSPRSTGGLQRLGSAHSPRHDTAAGPAAAAAAAVDDDYADIDRLLDQAELAAAAAGADHGVGDVNNVDRFDSVRSRDVSKHAARDQQLQQLQTGSRQRAHSRSADSGRGAAAGGVDRDRSADHRESDLADLLHKCDMSRLHSQERDELRSLVLLHKAAAVAAAQPNGLKNKEGERIELELACEPLNVCDVGLSLDDMALPAALLPTHCSMFRFIKSSRSTILEQTEDGKFKVEPGYMHMVRRHKLLRRLLLKLTRHVQQQQQVKGGGSSSKIMTLRDVWEAVPGSTEYLPLQLYRMLYRSLVNFIADNVSGGPLGVMIQDKMFKLVPHELIGLPQYRSKVEKHRIVYRLPHHFGAQRKVLTVGSDTGWIHDNQLNDPPPPQSPTAAVAAAAAAGDRWAPDPDTDGSDHHAADHGAYTDHRRHRDQAQQQQQQLQQQEEEVHPSKARDMPQETARDQSFPHKPMERPQTNRDRSLSLEPLVEPPKRGRPADLGPTAAAVAAAAKSKVVPTAPRDHARSQSPSAAAAAAAAAMGSGRRDSGARQQQQQHKADPSLWTSNVLAGLMARQDLSGLRNDERDELRSLALLHLFSAAVSKQESAAAAAAGTLGHEPYYLELACEPENIISGAVCLDDLALPPHFQPSNCTVSRFIKSYRCSLLTKTSDKDAGDKAMVVPQYMDVVRRHRLLQRLLCNLLQALRQKHFGLTRIYFVRDMEELLSKPGFYHPLLMYKELYRNTKSFVADCVHLCAEVLIADKGLVLVPADEAVKPVWQDRERVVYVLPAHNAATRQLNRDNHHQQQQGGREQGGEQQQQEEEEQEGGVGLDVDGGCRPAASVSTAAAALTAATDGSVSELASQQQQQHVRGQGPVITPQSSAAVSEPTPPAAGLTAAEPAVVLAPAGPAGPSTAAEATAAVEPPHLPTAVVAAAAAEPAAAAAAVMIPPAPTEAAIQAEQQQVSAMQEGGATGGAVAAATGIAGTALWSEVVNEDVIMAAAAAQDSGAGELGKTDPLMVVGVQQQQQQEQGPDQQGDLRLAAGVAAATGAVDADAFAGGDSALVELLPLPLNQQQQPFQQQPQQQQQQGLFMVEAMAGRTVAGAQAAFASIDLAQLLPMMNDNAYQPAHEAAAAVPEQSEQVSSMVSLIAAQADSALPTPAAVAAISSSTAPLEGEQQQQVEARGPGLESVGADTASQYKQ